MTEANIALDNFVPRDYQRCVFEAIERDGYKRVMAIWPRRCLSGDTHITMADGSWKFLKDVIVGDKILSWDGRGFVSDIVKNKWKTWKKPTKEIKSYGGLPIITSHDHKFATLTQGRDVLSWRSVSDIKEKRQVLLYAGTSLGNINDPDLAEFIGYMTCDGYCVDYQQPKFTNTNLDILNRVAFLGEKLFGYVPKWRPKGNGFDLGFTNGSRGGGGNNNKIKELFRAEGQDIQKSKKRLLSNVWNYDKESLLRFFAAVISSDGNIYCHDKGFIGDRGRSIPPVNEITISCGMSYDLGWDVYWLLRKFGVVPQVPYKERNSNWKVKVSKGCDIKLLLSCGRIYGKEVAQNEVLSRIPKNPYRQPEWNGCFRRKVKITHSRPEDLYDIETEKHHNFVANGYVVHNSGKDLTAWNLCIRELIRSPKTIYYIFPTFASGRRILWDNLTSDGIRMLDYLPPELVESRHEQYMRIKLKNGSLFQIIGSDSYDATLVGTNPQMVVFSEFALSDPMAYQFVRPILSANNGSLLIISTPRGKNTMYDMYNTALQNPDDWYVSHLTVEDTKHISIDAIMKERELGEMSEDLQRQEYWCDFSLGVEGGYYTKYIDRLRLNSQIGPVPWEPQYPVHTAWDIGVRDMTSIIFFQVVGQAVKIIDSYEKNKEGLEHYASIIKSKPYVYGKHVGPHDIRNMEFSTGITRWEKARQLGITFDVADKLSIMDGIEAVRSTLPKMWFDEVKCRKLIKALENYRAEYDSKKKVYKHHPLHDVHSNFCFVAGTKVVTDQGSLNIEDIKVGMRVKTPTGFKHVLKTHEKLAEELCDVSVADSKITCTPNHGIFTQRGLITADSLRYNDVLEYHCATRSLMWKMLYGFYSKVFALSGLKRTILSLKTGPKQCLMGFFIGGMETILSDRSLHGARIQCCIGRFGSFIMERFLRAWSYITWIMTPIITLFKTFRSLIKGSICVITQIFRDPGRSLRSAKNCCALIAQRRQNGTEAMLEKSGIDCMQQGLFLPAEESNMRRSARCAKKTTKERSSGKNIVQTPVKLGIESLRDLILSTGLAVFVRLYLTVTSIVSKRHVVRSVRRYQCGTQRRVFDLTVEEDNCYYANGYLVSNSDSIRYLCIHLPKLRDGMTPDDIERMRNEAQYGKQSNLPRFFR